MESGIDIRELLTRAWDLFWAFRWFTLPLLGILLLLWLIRYVGFKMRQHHEDKHQKKIMKEAIREVREELLEEK